MRPATVPTGSHHPNSVLYSVLYTRFSFEGSCCFLQKQHVFTILMHFCTLLLGSLFGTGAKRYGLGAFNICTSGSLCFYCSHSRMIILLPNHILTMHSLRSGAAKVPLICIPAQWQYFYIVSSYIPQTDIYFCLLCNVNIERANIFTFF